LNIHSCRIGKRRLDGNKQTASMVTVLAINGVEMPAKAGEAWRFVTGLNERHAFEIGSLDAWLR